MALAAAGFVAAVIHTSAAGAPRPSSAQAPATPLPPDYFETRVRPILAATCYDCHTDDEKGGLRLDSRAAVLTGGESGPAIVPGDPDNSLLIQAVRQLPGKPKMPKGKAPRLTDADIAVLADWIRAGAPWPATAATPAPGAAAPAKDKPITAEQRAFWSFQPLQRAAAPAVARGDWPRTDIDRFVLAALERDGLAPVGTADKRDADPPRHARPHRPAADLGGGRAPSRKTTSPDAFAKVVDRLLASPQYGERWGRLWLDVARYGEDDYRSLDPMGRGYNPYPERLPVSRLGDPGVQRRPALRPVRQGAAGRRPAWTRRSACSMLPALGFLGLGPWYLRQRRGRDHARRRAARPRRRGDARLPRPDGRLRALPRSQVRSDPDQRTTTRSPASS